MYVNSRVTSGRHDDVMTGHAELSRQEGQQRFYDNSGSLDLRVQPFHQKQDEVEQEQKKQDWVDSRKAEQRKCPSPDQSSVVSYKQEVEDVEVDVDGETSSS